MSFRFPRNYWEASRTLHFRLTQSLQVHDDLTLRFVHAGVAVYFRKRRIILFHMDANHITVNAAGSDGETERAVVEHIERFLPRGYHAKFNDAGRMLLHWPDGKTRVGNRQRIALVPHHDPL